MFYSYEQFKKATKIIFDEMKAEKFKLSDFRLRLSQLIGFNTIEALEANFKSEVQKTITVVTIAPQFNVIKKDFLDNEEGYKKAIAYFSSKILEIEPYMNQSELECFIDDGFYSKSISEYEIYLIHNDD